ncbi:hypothetical protein O181_027950 [Austropuccinia psidii MF-1]|uniref:Uncharacterized protein n=1 Tax=Austropuccinia psidii MF-1 TaxID=1389203 RepID=A0A9Q3CRW2_9BASI|nr:hypothetical protein [Austropuccinia psidii MF-1]
MSRSVHIRLIHFFCCVVYGLSSFCPISQIFFALFEISHGPRRSSPFETKRKAPNQHPIASTPKLPQKISQFAVLSSQKMTGLAEYFSTAWDFN